MRITKLNTIKPVLTPSTALESTINSSRTPNVTIEYTSEFGGGLLLRERGTQVVRFVHMSNVQDMEVQEDSNGGDR